MIGGGGLIGAAGRFDRTKTQRALLRNGIPSPLILIATKVIEVKEEKKADEIQFDSLACLYKYLLLLKKSNQPSSFQ